MEEVKPNASGANTTNAEEAIKAQEIETIKSKKKRSFGSKAELNE